MCIIVDGMEQSKTYLPHFSNVTKGICSLWKLKVHISGAMVHGKTTEVFVDTNQWEHGSNLLINILYRILNIYKEKIPAVLYLQLDNCLRGNKNKYVFAFLSHLVELNIFRKIKVNFLMVGHTHEIIDQFFSRISLWLRRNDAVTIPDLLDGIKRSYNPRPEARELEEMFNYREWISPHVERIGQHSRPHAFR
jgi:hypothetical protein